MSLKKRHDLPPFKELDKTFDVEKIIKVVQQMPVEVDDLKEKDGYGDLVGGKTAKLQKAFGLKFDTIEDAYKFLQDNDVEESEFRKGLNNKRMAWDFRNYVKPFENYIVKDDTGRYEVNGSPYKQVALTQYNPDMEDRVYNKPWHKGAKMIIEYFKEVLNTREIPGDTKYKLGKGLVINED